MTVDATSSPQNAPTRLLGIALLAAAVVLAVLFPGDLPFHDDECALISNALTSNAQGRLATFGLGGTYGYGYGPIPTQFYQLILLFTHELRALVVVRAILFVGVMTWALRSIAKSLALPPFMIGAFLCAPWIWFFCRLPWDNTFNLPLGLLATAAYLRWYAGPTRVNAIAWTTAAVAMPLVHLSAVAVPLSLFVHAVVSSFSKLRKAVGLIALGAIIACSTSVPYIWQTADQLMQKVSLRVAGYPSESTRAQPSRLQSAALAMSASWVLSGEQKFFTEWPTSKFGGVISALKPLTWIAHAWMGIGAVVGITALARRNRDPRTAAAALALLIITAYAIVFAAMRAPFFPHYLSGAIPAAVLLCWIGVELLWRRAWTRAVVIIPSVATALITALLAVAIHQTQGGDSLFSPTLGNLISIAHDLDGAPHAVAWTDSRQLFSSPAQLRLIRKIYTRVDGTAVATGEIAIRRRRAFPGDGWLIVERVDAAPALLVEIRLRE